MYGFWFCKMHDNPQYVGYMTAKYHISNSNNHWVISYLPNASSKKTAIFSLFLLASWCLRVGVCELVRWRLDRTPWWTLLPSVNIGWWCLNLYVDIMVRIQKLFTEWKCNKYGLRNSNMKISKLNYGILNGGISITEVIFKFIKLSASCVGELLCRRSAPNSLYRSLDTPILTVIIYKYQTCFYFCAAHWKVVLNSDFNVTFNTTLVFGLKPYHTMFIFSQQFK